MWVGQLVKNLPTMQETWFDSQVGKIPWRRKWQPPPVFLPGESHGQRSLAGYSPWDHKSRTRLSDQTTTTTTRQLGKALLFCFSSLTSSGVIVNPVIFERALVNLEASFACPFSPTFTCAPAFKLNLSKYISLVCMPILLFLQKYLTWSPLLFFTFFCVVISLLVLKGFCGMFRWTF